MTCLVAIIPATAAGVIVGALCAVALRPMRGVVPSGARRASVTMKLSGPKAYYKESVYSRNLTRRKIINRRTGISRLSIEASVSATHSRRHQMARLIKW